MKERMKLPDDRLNALKKEDDGDNKTH